MAKDFTEVLCENMDRNRATKAGDELQCRGCQATFVRGDWCFHQLCGGCFARFDARKMAGRFGAGPQCEDVDAWLAEGRPGAEVVRGPAGAN